MSEEYVAQVLLEINGRKITDFKSVEEGEYEVHKRVKTMSGKGHVTVVPDPSVTVEYIIPLDTPEFDFDTVKNGTLTIDYLNGKRVKYSGVYTEKVGSAKHTGDDASTKTIVFSAKTRK